MITIHPLDDFWPRRRHETAMRFRAALRGRFKPSYQEHYVRAHSAIEHMMRRIDRMDWCTKNCRGLWFIRLVVEVDYGFPGSSLYKWRFAFFDDVDAMMFKMQFPTEWE